MFINQLLDLHSLQLQVIYNHKLMFISALRTFAKPTSFSLCASAASRCYFSDQRPKESSPLQTLATNQVISKNVGINKFLTQVYTTTGLAFGGALASAYAVLSIPALSAMMMQISFGGAIAMFIGFISSSYMQPKYTVEVEKLNNNEKIETVKPINSMLRQAMFGMGVVGLGLTGAPLIGLASAVSPSIVPTCLGLTTAIFGGASLMAYNMKKDSMLKYSGVLFGSLLGLIGLQLGGLAAGMIMGPNVFSTMMFSSSSYITIGLFTAFIMYDTHVAIKMYEQGTPDHLGLATQFLLDIWNIFMSLLRIFSQK